MNKLEFQEEVAKNALNGGMAGVMSGFALPLVTGEVHHDAVLAAAHLAGSVLAYGVIGATAGATVTATVGGAAWTGKQVIHHGRKIQQSLRARLDRTRSDYATARAHVESGTIDAKRDSARMKPDKPKSPRIRM